MRELLPMTQLDPTAATAEALPSPIELEALHPLTAEAHEFVKDVRGQVIDIMEGRDPRIIAVVGPCSMDDTKTDGQYSALRFADRLQEVACKPKIAKNVLTVMRCPIPKPRTNLGWRGLEQTSVVRAHEITTEIVNKRVPLASEVMNPSQLARLAGRLSVAWVGARDNQVTGLRHLLSAHPELPVFAKNSERGSLKPAMDALMTIEAAHDNVEVVMPDGRIGRVPRSSGNSHTGLLWRAGDEYNSFGAYEKGIYTTSEDEHPYGVDMSHGGAAAHDPHNKKSVEGQLACFDHVTALMLGGTLCKQPSMIMIEGYLLAGADTSGRTPGKSLTDPCVDIEQVEDMLYRLSEVQAVVADR